MNIRVLTLNLHGWQESEQLAKFSRIAEFIAENRIGIVAFQEVAQHRHASLLDGRIRVDNAGHLILQRLNQLSDQCYTMHWDWSHYGWDVYEEGVAVLSSFPVVDLSSKYVSQSSSKEYWKSRKIIRAGIKLNEEVVDVFSCHTGWYHDQDEPFAGQLDSLCALVQERPNRSLIMGDFNNGAGTPGYDLLTEQFIDLFPLGSKEAGYTFRGGIAGWGGNETGQRIDYVFTDQSVSSVKAEVVFESEPVSDHFGVMMELEW